MTTANEPDPAKVRDTSGLARHTERWLSQGAPASVPTTLARVLAHLGGRARSHPDSPATGHYLISDAEWHACIGELRLRGFRITESIVTKGDRVANDIGYSLVGEPLPPGPGRQTCVGGHSPTAPRPVRGWFVDRSRGLAR